VPDTYANNMSLRAYHSGDGWQDDVSLSVGGACSLYPANGLAWRRESAIGGIRIDRVEASNGTGIGQLTAESSDSLTWTAPGEAAGEEVEILQGETRTLPSENGEKCIVVTRVRDNELQGIENVVLIDRYNTVVAGSNFVSESASGDKNRGVWLVNEGTETVTLIELVATGCEFELEAPDGGGLIEVTADEDTEPAAPSWVSSWNAGDITIAPGAAYGLRIRNTYTDAISAAVPAVITIEYNTVSLTGLRCDQRGLSRRGMESNAAFLLYVGVDAPPTCSGEPDDERATVAALTYTYTPAEEHTYYCETLERNKFGLVSAPDTATPVRIDASGDDVGRRPSAPSEIVVLAQEDGTVLVSAEYRPVADALAYRADTWLVYETFDGTAPDPVVDTPTEYALITGVPLVHLTAAQIDDSPYKVIVKTARGDIECEDETIYSATVTYEWYPTRRPQVAQGAGHGPDLDFTEPSETIVIDVATNTRWIITASNTQLWYGDTLVYVLTDAELRTTFAFQTGTVSGAAASSVEVSGGKIYFSAAGVRQVEIDPAGTISIERVANGDNEAAVATIPGAPTLTTRCTYTQSNAYAYGGTYSALMAADGTVGTSFQHRLITASPALFKPGATYTLSAWVYIPAGCTVSYARIQLYLNGVLYQTATVTTKGSWIFTTITATAPAESTSSNWHLILTVSGDSSNLDNKVYWDNISLVEVEDTPTITVGSIDESVAVDEVNEPGATWVRYGELVFPVYSPIPGSNIAAFAVDSAGVVKTDITAVVCNTDEECF
jgi:hypothetical protein